MWPGYEKRIKLLQEGKTLRMVHQVYGSYNFSLNQQGTMIHVEPVNARAIEHSQKSIKSVDLSIHPYPDNIQSNAEKFILWGYGEWFIVVAEEVSTVKVVIKPEHLEKL
jgi:hypothetical protein